jgi:cobyrinic acid a,c-diamide synthase
VLFRSIAGARHERLIRDCLAAYVGLPVLGALPRFRLAMPERHMGLVPTYEHPQVTAAIDGLRSLAETHLDLAGLLAVVRSAPPLPPLAEAPSLAPVGPRVRVGVIQDAAFQFYYPENLEALAQAGAEVVLVSALSDQALPEIQGLYIGGGFPETQAQRLAENVAFRRSVREAAGRGLPVYAECGGLMFLARSLTMEGSTFPMAGVLPVDVEVMKRPQGHGYVAATVDRANPFYPVGATLKGHEFHYSRIVQADLDPALTCLRVERGVGLAGGRDGLVVGNVFAAYTHVHALGTREWARGIVGRAQSGKTG